MMEPTRQSRAVRFPMQADEFPDLKMTPMEEAMLHMAELI
jgi:hypothetical protein